jgi:hypothetical protein
LALAFGFPFPLLSASFSFSIKAIEEDLTTGPLPWRETILSYIVVGLDHIYKSGADLSREGVGDRNDNPASRIRRRICKWQGIEIRLYRRHDNLID